jgi:phosphoribosylformylglycinamidine cyclo-ligase
MDEYKKAGVDIEKTDSLLNNIASCVTDTKGFGGLYDNGDHYLVGATDGVGTKILLGREYNKLEGLGIDCVAMCVNDIVCTGAKPLFFLDYYASSNIKEEEYITIINSIKKGCDIANIPLIGGETAELPQMFGNDNFDIAGFCVGRVKKRNLIDGKKIEHGDIIIGIGSSGFHSNGYSLVRKWFNKDKHNIEEVMKPTIIYSDIIQKLLKVVKVKGISHITGGGFSNLNRILPAGTKPFFNHFHINHRPGVFKQIEREMNIPGEQMQNIFNNGIGMMVVLKKKYESKALNFLNSNGFYASIIGEIYEN